MTDRFILSCKNVQKASYTKKDTVWGMVYISKQVFGSENQAICSIHISTLKIQFSKPYQKTPQNHQNHFDTDFDKSLIFQWLRRFWVVIFQFLVKLKMRKTLDFRHFVELTIELENGGLDVKTSDMPFLDSGCLF